MNHQPFEQWLLADEPPTGEQALELREHLRDCPRCRELEASWSDVHRIFLASEQTAPLPGFTNRWQARIHAQQDQSKMKSHRYQPWFFFALSISIAGVLLLMLSYQLWQNFHSSAQLLLIKALLLSFALSIVDIAQLALSTFLQVAARFPILLWILLLGISGFMGSLWVSVGKQLVTTRRSLL